MDPTADTEELIQTAARILIELNSRDAIAEFVDHLEEADVDTFENLSDQFT